MLNGTATVLQLLDGRYLSFSEVGPPSGTPVFSFHGTPGSRLQLRAVAEQAGRKLGIRVILPDRPGCGFSTPMPGRQLTDWPRDVAAMVEHLGLGRFGVLGVSGGGPYALACAHALGDRLISTAVISSFSPLRGPDMEEGMMVSNRLAFRLSRLSPHALGALMSIQFALGRHVVGRVIDLLARQLPASDRAALEQPRVRAQLADELRRIEPGDGKVAAEELRLLVQHWGFRLEDIPGLVHIWHGTGDVNVPIQHGRWLAQTIPNARLHEVADGGHLIYLDFLEVGLRTAAGM